MSPFILGAWRLLLGWKWTGNIFEIRIKILGSIHMMSILQLKPWNSATWIHLRAAWYLSAAWMSGCFLSAPKDVWSRFGIVIQVCAQVGSGKWRAGWVYPWYRANPGNLGTKTLLFVELLALSIMEGAFLSQTNEKWTFPSNGAW